MAVNSQLTVPNANAPKRIKVFSPAAIGNGNADIVNGSAETIN
jgi:hypothetical protein